MSEVAKIIETMNSKFNADAASGLDIIFQFNIEGEGEYNLTVKDGACTLAEGENDDANCTLIMNADTLQGIVTGETDGMQAFMAGQLRVEGDMMLATKLGELFPA